MTFYFAYLISKKIRWIFASNYNLRNYNKKVFKKHLEKKKTSRVGPFSYLF